jgi:GTP-binding protein Era
MSSGSGVQERGGADNHRCGYVALVGKPNVGKSTLMNSLLGQKLSIVTAKPQTTRQRIAGIKTTPEGQVIYVDTPGLHRTAKKALNRYMNRVARASFLDVDLILFLVEACRWTRQDDNVAGALLQSGIPVVVIINKIDLVNDKSRLLQFVDENINSESFSDVFMISAKKGNGIAEMEQAVFNRLPFSRPYYDQDQFTDRSERFLVAELIREQLMLRLHQEIPYSLTVEIETFNRDDHLLRIGAIIWVERSSQKGMVIGKGGEVLKQVGSGARHAAEALLGEKVFLRLFVKVSQGWADDERLLKQFGYDEKGF